MYWKYLERDDDNLLVELKRGSFRTRIELNFTPNENFRGFAIGCNYHYQGHPIGYLKDNGLLIRQIPGKEARGILDIDSTIIQAGPILVDNFLPQRDWRSQGFTSHHIVSGLHVHIGYKKTGNYLIGCTQKATYKQIIDKYLHYHAQYALKLPGLNQGSFYLKTKHREIQYGLFPIPAALILEAKLDMDAYSKLK